MTIFHYINVRMQNIPNFVSIIGMNFMHYAIEEWVSKSMHTTHINNPMKQVGFWAVDELKVSWDDNTYFIRSVIRKVTTMT